jgi:uncharacterized phage protein (TIGR02220 family)
MGEKSSYFKHMLEAHYDIKFMNLLSEKGLKGYGFFFLLLEVFGRAYSNDDNKSLTQPISLRNLSSIMHLRSDAVEDLCKTCASFALISYTRSTYPSHVINLTIPNFLKYYGKPKKESSKSDVQENRIEENRIEENREDKNKVEQAQQCTPEKSDSIPYQKIIDFLNQEIGTSYKAGSKETQKLINARFKEGFTYEDFTRVIVNKKLEWFNNPEMKTYLRPSTLFGNKFESYLNSPLAKDIEEKNKILDKLRANTIQAEKQLDSLKDGWRPNPNEVENVH